MKKVAPIIAALALLYGAWVLWFSATGSNELFFDSREDALSAAYHRLWDDQIVERSEIMETGGASNSWLGIDKKGFVIVLKDYPFSSLKPRDFVIFEADGILVHHPVRVKTEAGWIAEGDGNDGSDPTLVTEDNFVGLVYKKLTFRY